MLAFTPGEWRTFRWSELSIVFQSAMNALNPVMNICAQINDVLLGFDRLYWLELLEFTDSEVHAQVVVREEHKQPAGLVHGGVYASVAEAIASIATGMTVLEEGNMAMGMSNSTNFLRPVTAGTVHAHATRIHRGRTTWLWDVEFSDDDGRVSALRLRERFRRLGGASLPAEGAVSAGWGSGFRRLRKRLTRRSWAA
jgi:uncharacterized protein (TIGR00369 family)